MRFGIPFGERARPETVTPIFIRKILNGEEITIHGDGSQTRQFIYVKDLARGLRRLPPAQGRKTRSSTSTAGSGSASSTSSATSSEILGKKARITFVDQRAGPVQRPDDLLGERPRRLLGWEPRFSYREALETYARAYRRGAQEARHRT